MPQVQGNGQNYQISSCEEISAHLNGSRERQREAGFTAWQSPRQICPDSEA
jgi:hypothetical protein